MGFTLVEIVVVLLIISVVLTLVGVSLSGAAGGVAVRESAGQMLASLRYARSYAATHGCECRMTFSREKNSIELTCRANPDDEQFTPLPAGHTVKLNEHVRFAAIMIRPRAGDAMVAGGATDAGGEGADDNRAGDDGAPARMRQPDTITFEPTGEADAAGIEITDGRMIYSLVVSPSAGLARMQKGPLVGLPNDREDLDA